MRIIGIDPGLASTGYGVIDYDGHKSVLVECGTVVTTKREAMPQRLQKIHLEITEVVQRTAPTIAAMEGLYFVQNITSGIAVAQGRGVAILAAINAIRTATGEEPDFGEYTPMQIKQAVVGYGKASKAQVAQMVCNLLGMTDVKDTQSNHAADALAVALCHAHTSGFAKAAVRGKLVAEMRAAEGPRKTLKQRAEEQHTGEVEAGDRRRATAKALLGQMRTKARRGGRRKA